MKEILEVKKSKIIVNSELKKYDDVVLFPEKLAKANETLTQYGIPEELVNESAQKGEKHNFWTKGFLLSADAKENTFSIFDKIEVIHSEKSYTITALPHIIDVLVKGYWGKMIEVHIKLKSKKQNKLYFELIDFKM